MFYLVCPSLQVITEVRGLPTTVYPMCTPILQHTLRPIIIVPRMLQNGRDDHSWSVYRMHFDRFYDVTVGISDPNVFNPPPECI